MEWLLLLERINAAAAAAAAAVTPKHHQMQELVYGRYPREAALPWLEQAGRHPLR